MRKATTILTVLIAGLLTFPTLFCHPMFRQGQAPELVDLMAESPLQPEQGLAEIADYLKGEQGTRIRDNWGLQHGPSGPADPAAFKEYVDQVNNLNTALNHLNNHNPSRANTPLNRYHNQYKLGQKVKVKDLLPTDENHKILYALYRYNRAVMWLGLADTNSRVRRMTTLHQKALYDLRRTVAATEQLGELKNTHGTYWGAGAHAWEGFALDSAHGNLPVHQIYTNLAICYLRLGAAAGYPYKAPDYLNREHKKYSWGDDPLLTPIVSGLIRTATDRRKKEQVSLELFRLIMALHNMEAAGRGIEGRQDEDLYHYTVAVLMNHLSDFKISAVTATEVITFLKLARKASHEERRVYQMALKEEVLQHLAENQLAEAASLLATIDVGRLEDLIQGPDRGFGLLFTDLAQYRYLEKGELQRVLNHLERRSRELSDPEVIRAHKQVVRILGRAFFSAIGQRLSKYNAAEAGALLAELGQNESMNGLPEFKAQFQARCMETMGLRVAVNIWLCHHSSWYLKTKLLGLTALIAWGLYLWWCYKSHRKLAMQILKSGYGRELD